MGRAVAHGRLGFSDPTALALLPAEARARAERVRAGAKPRGFRERAGNAYLARLSFIMATRTIAIDEGIVAASAPQLVILGAGLDGRAWRMPALRDVTVFEVDHPVSQRDKRERVAALTAVARDIRFVPVDFTRDDLDATLTGAGHDPARPTTWLWEGVVMYLTPAEVAATLSIVSRRSVAGSQLLILYHAPALMLHIVGPVVRRVGEPLRSTFTAEAMRALLAAHRFDVLRDRSVRELGRSLPPPIPKATRFASHLRLVIAVRGAG